VRIFFVIFFHKFGTLSKLDKSICNKHFKNEFYIDKHMDNKHNNMLVNTTSICLADLCPIFGCEIKNKYIKKVDSKQFMNQPSCTKEDEERNKYKCQVLTKRCFSKS
jgi:hypothetical protein